MDIQSSRQTGVKEIYKNLIALQNRHTSKGNLKQQVENMLDKIDKRYRSNHIDSSVMEYGVPRSIEDVKRQEIL